MFGIRFSNVFFSSDLIHASNPFVDRLPEELKKPYLDDLNGRVLKMSGVQDGFVGGKPTRHYLIPHTVLVAYARKPFN